MGLRDLAALAEAPVVLVVLAVLVVQEVQEVQAVQEVLEVLEGLEVVLGVLEGQLYQETIWTAPAQCLSLTYQHSPPPPRWLAGSWSPG